MILTGPEIKHQVELGRISISDFNEKHLDPNSYNFSLGPTLKVYDEEVLDPRVENKVSEITIPEEGFVIGPEKVYLGHISERIGSGHYVPIMRGRSSIGRLGLFINLTADLIDQGAFGQWTLQLHAVQPIRIYAGMKIGQMTFWVPKGAPQLYAGKYQEARGPGSSQSWVDFSTD